MVRSPTAALPGPMPLGCLEGVTESFDDVSAGFPDDLGGV